MIDKDDPVRRRQVAVISDITARKRSEEMAWWRANYDELTEPPNRRLLIDRLKHALVGAERHDHGVAVLFIDLDEFKPINDRFGHQAGDEVLKQVGARIGLCTRKEDTVARLGGDEFVVMLATIRTEEDALRIAQKILERLHGPFQVGDKRLKIGASIGVAFSPRPGWTAESLLKKADAASYAAKAAGRHSPRLHAEDAAGSAGRLGWARRNAASARAVCVPPCAASCPGVAAATILPPAAPPSGPRSMIQSASAQMSRLCSTTTSVLPASTSRCSTRISFSTSAMCRPTVGSSST